MRLFNLSFRYKLPLWGGFLIVVSALVLSISFLVEARDDLKRGMLSGAERLGRILAQPLQPALLHDDVWRGFEVINSPYSPQTPPDDFRAEGLIVLNNRREVFVSTQPDAYPLLAPLVKLGPAFHDLNDRLSATPDGQTQTLEADNKILTVVPLVADEVLLGHLIFVHPADFFRPRFKTLAGRAAVITALALAVLLPINWYWGQRMAQPLVQLSARMDTLGREPPEPLPAVSYPYRDELGHLFDAYDRMLRELDAKAALEKEIVKEDRLAAMGRLSAGIAHEINNPLGGLVTAVDTLKKHGGRDPLSERVLPLLERGLAQIRDIVAALLVEVKSKTRPLGPHDVEDVHTLLAQEAKQRGVHWNWRNEIHEEVALPATLVRQVLINLTLNAVQAAESEGSVETRVWAADGRLRIESGNSGRTIPPKMMEHLFEPFTGLKEEGHGLGLWITHRIIRELSGHIAVESRDRWTRFSVELPLGEQTCPVAESA